MARRVGEGGPPGPGDDEAIERLIGAMRRASGVDFGHYKRPALARRLLEIAGGEGGGAGALGEFAARLEGAPAGASRLVTELLNNTTSMFRDAAAFDLLRERALPELVTRRACEGSTALRAWVPACSTGEEAYSIAMCLVDEVDRQGVALEASVVASDVDGAALARAAEGLLDEASAARVPGALAERWLGRERGARRVAPELRARVRFARHDLLSSALPAPAEAAFASFDLVSCRNLLIYLAPASQERALLRLIKTCAPGALLLLGEAEWAPESFGEQLEPFGGAAPLYWVTP